MNIGDALYEDRLIVLIEREGIFRQVILTPEQFKRVSGSVYRSKIGREGLRPGYEQVELEVGEQEWPGDTFIGCASHTP